MAAAARDAHGRGRRRARAPPRRRLENVPTIASYPPHSSHLTISPLAAPLSRTAARRGPGSGRDTLLGGDHSI
ncbi:hypothetical protein OAO87_03345, partial [bacterium]|nr:hypothetical protein [bacterium]